MLSIFRTNQVFISILLIFYIFILWGSTFVISHEWLPEAMGTTSRWLFEQIGTDTWGSKGLAILILLFNSILLSLILTRYRVEYEATLFSGIFYVLLSSLIPDFLHFSPLLIANTFLLFAVFNMVQVYKNSNCAPLIFNIGFWIGIASSFYFSYAIFVFWALICLNILRAFKLREWLMMISGFFVPYILLGTYHFWHDDFSKFWQLQVSKNLSFLDWNGGNDMITYTKITVFGLIILLTIASFGSYNFKKNIQLQKRITIFYWLLFFGAMTVLFQANLTLGHLQITVIPLAAFLAMTFLNMTSRWAEAFHFLLLVLVLALQFKSVFI